MSKYRVYRIEWVDAHNTTGGWNDPDELKAFGENEAYKVISIGYLVYEDELCIVLSSRISPETDDYPEHFGMLERIPKKIIDTRKEL